MFNSKVWILFKEWKKVGNLSKKWIQSYKKLAYKIYTHSWVKTYQRFGNRAELPPLGKEHVQKSVSNIILDDERLSAFPLRSRISILTAGYFTIGLRLSIKLLSSLTSLLTWFKTHRHTVQYSWWNAEKCALQKEEQNAVNLQPLLLFCTVLEDKSMWLDKKNICWCNQFYWKISKNNKIIHYCG